MKIRRQPKTKPIPKLTDEEYIQLIKKYRTFNYSEREDIRLITLLNAHYPIIWSYKPGMTPEENLQAAKDAVKNRNVICL